jgi:hypothetical protein
MSDMTEDQLKNIAIGFLHVLRTQHDVYNESMKPENSSDREKLGAFMARTMHLKSTPSADDLQKMDDFLHEHMQSDTAALKAVRPAGPANFNTFSRSS